MDDSSERVFVEIYKDATGEVATCMGPMGRREAERVERGANINLDHANWSTRIVDKATEAAK